jgi:hypothetical protein
MIKLNKICLVYWIQWIDLLEDIQSIRTPDPNPDWDVAPKIMKKSDLDPKLMKVRPGSEIYE